MAVEGRTPTAPVAVMDRATTTEATHSTTVEVPSAPPIVTIVVDDSPLDHATRARGRARSAEVVKGSQSKKRARVEVPPGPSSPPPSGGTVSPPPLAPWRPAIEEVLGRQLAETDHVVDPQVVAALGRACTPPQDMARWAEMDNESLLLSSMRSLVAKCQTGIVRLDAAEARTTKWVAKREELQASLAAKEAMLVEEAGRNAGEAQVLVEHLKEELKEEETQNAHLAFELNDLWTVVARQEEDLRNANGTNKRLLSQRNMAKGELEVALKGKAAEIESALASQEAKLKEEFLAEHNAIMEEEVGKLTADYNAQLPGIRDRAWEFEWKAALKKAGVPGDSPFLRSPPKFPRSDSELIVISLPSPCPPSQACPEVSAAPEVPLEAPPTASAELEASPTPEVVQAPPEAAAPEASVPEASAAVSEATSTVPEASAVVAEVPPESDCNVEAAAL
ncbi:hypothetical protein AAC387_Pa02g1268 [Persea americana]